MKNIFSIIAATFIIVFSFGTHSSNAQISFGGQPYSFSHTLTSPKVLHPNPSELQNKNLDINKDCNAVEFARFLSLNVSLKDQAWQKTKASNGSIIYRLSVQSPNALAVGAYFSDLFIPNGAKLYIYSPDHKQLIGAFTSSNNSPSGLFATEYIVGNELIIEYMEPIAVKGQGHFIINEILHAYRGISPINNRSGFGSAGFCEVNVNCPEGDGKKQQRDAVLRLLIKKGKAASFCTGSLINNTSEDQTPYIITANHCATNSSVSDHEQWIFYFHYQSEDCENPNTEPEHQTMVGCSEIASSMNAGIQGSDFYLVLLSETIPNDYRPFFIGWNREGSGSDNGYTIHHPEGDIKKISHYSEPLESATFQQGIHDAYWKVKWVETETNHGVTEFGSSGSPIFDSQGYLIGTLSGGAASCTSLFSPDYYGKLSIHWTQNGNDEDQQLSPWLDPLNTGLQKIGGVYLGIDEEEILSDNLFEAIPNPVDDQLTLYFHKSYNDYKIQISNISGHILQEFNVNGNQAKKISVSHLRKGIYFIRVSSSDLVQTHKVVKL